MSDTAPPLTAEDIARDLRNSNFSTYFHIGSVKDLGWENAQIIYGILPALRIYCLKDHSYIRKWIGNKRPGGVAFGFDDEPKVYLTRKETEDLGLVLTAIIQSRE